MPHSSSAAAAPDHDPILPSAPSFDPLSIEEARAAILFAHFVAGIRHVELQGDNGGEPDPIPSFVDEGDARAAWRGVGRFAGTWIDFAARLADRTKTVDASGASCLAYAFNAGAHFATEAIDRTVTCPPPLPTGGELRDLEQALVRREIAKPWLTRSIRARQTFKALTRPAGRGTFTPNARKVSK